jgi:hypothetical protein
MTGASEQPRPPERIGTTGQRFDRRLYVVIGRQSAQRTVAAHASHHDIASHALDEHWLRQVPWSR